MNFVFLSTTHKRFHLGIVIYGGKIQKCYFGWPMEGLDHYDGSALEGYFLCTYGRAEFIAAVALWSVISGCQWKGKIAYGCNILDSYFPGALRRVGVITAVALRSAIRGVHGRIKMLPVVTFWTAISGCLCMGEISWMYHSGGLFSVCL